MFVHESDEFEYNLMECNLAFEIKEWKKNLLSKNWMISGIVATSAGVFPCASLAKGKAPQCTRYLTKSVKPIDAAM